MRAYRARKKAQPAPQPAPTVASTARPTSINAAQVTAAQAKAIADEQEDNMTIDQVLASKQYISAAITPNGYSMSQNLNWKLENDQQLNANERFVDDNLTAAMHPLGSDMMLYRGAHSDLIDALGVKNYQQMTDAQLANALVGASWQSKSFTSTSYDKSKNPFLTGNMAGGREVVMNIHAAGQAQGLFVNKRQAEVVLKKGTNFEITGARFTGNTRYPRTSTRGMREIELDIEVW